MSSKICVVKWDQPVPCDVCGITFSRPWNRDRHQSIIHSKIRRGGGVHPCLLCNQNFRQSQHLSRHYHIIHNAPRLTRKVHQVSEQCSGHRKMSHRRKYFFILVLVHRSEVWKGFKRSVEGPQTCQFRAWSSQSKAEEGRVNSRAPWTRGLWWAGGRIDKIWSSILF